MDTETLVKALFFAAMGDGSFSETKQLPSAVAGAAKKWTDGNNIPTDGEDVSATFYLYHSKTNSVADLYIVNYDGDDPEQFRAVGVFQSNTLVGEWLIASE